MAKNDLLCIHAGANRVQTIDQLREIPTPPPQGNRHKPVPHAELYESILWSLEDMGYRVRRQDLAVGQSHEFDGTVYENTALFGMLDVVPQGIMIDEDGNILGDDAPESGLLVGFRSSNVRRFAIRIVAGTRVFICDNMALSGEDVLVNKPHTLRLNLGSSVREGMGRMLEAQHSFEQVIHGMKEVELTDTQAKAVLYNLFAGKGLPMRAFPAVERNYFRPDPEWTDCTPRNLWGVHNACTRAIREEPLNRQMDRSQKVSRLLLPDAVTASLN